MFPQSKIDYSIDLLKRAEPLALKINPDGFRVAFSGGKDSQVIYHLAKMAGVKFTAHMQITTVDPPELLRFIRKHYPDVIFHRPAINFYKLIIKKKMLPLRNARYCCEYLKEQAGAGSLTVIGVRRAESFRRSQRQEVEVLGKKGKGTFDQFNRDKETTMECVGGKDKIVLSPILNWTTPDVWNFIHGLKLPYCELYEKGYTRIGCVFCPMASKKSKQRDHKNFPGIERQFKKTIQHLIDTTDYGKDVSGTADEMFDWWISNIPFKQYFGMLRNQLKIPFDDL